MKKLLISDYDGTIKTVNLKANIKAIKSFVDAGNILNISTARSYKEIIGQLKLFHIPYSYLTCNCGAVMFDNKGRVIDYNAFSKLEIKYIADIVNSSNNCIRVLYVDKYGEKSSSISDLTNITNIEIICNPLYDLRKDFKKVPGYKCDRYYGNVYSIKKHFINKAYGAACLLNYLKENKDITDLEVYCVGNSLDDLLLLKRYNGYSIASSLSLKNSGLQEVSSVRTLIKKM